MGRYSGSRIFLVTALLLVKAVLAACQANLPPGGAASLVIPTGLSTPAPVSALATQAVTPTSPTALLTATPALNLLAATSPAFMPTGIPRPAASPTPTSLPPTSTLLFTGIIVPARCVQAAIDETGNPDYPYEQVSDLVRSADLAIGTLNASISDFPSRTGCKQTFVLTGGAENADALARAGFDAVSAATNHIKNCGRMDCGDRAFLDTLANLRRVGVVPIGAGENLADALQPVVFTLNGVRFGIVSLGQIEPMAFAGENTPGIAVLTPENLKAAIAAARVVSDVVIAMPHWGPEYVSVPNWIQRNLARQAVEYGADLVVGNHTHVVQGLQEIDGVPVFYGLGNFVFDQYWQPELYQSVILRVTFQGSSYKSYELIPVRSDRGGRVQRLTGEEAAQVLERIEAASEPLK